MGLTPALPVDGNGRPIPNPGVTPGVGYAMPQMGTQIADATTGQTVAPLVIQHGASSQINDPLGNPQSDVQTGFDNQPQSGVPAGTQQLVQPFSPAPTIAANIATGSQVVTPSAMSGTSRGAAWSIQVGSYLIIANSNATNKETVRVTAVTTTTFTATFVQTKTGPAITIVGEVLNQAKDSTIADGSSPAGVPSGATFLWNGSLNTGVGGVEIMRSASGENSGATGAGTNIAAEYEFTSGGPPLANGTPSQLQYDREVAALGKIPSNAGAGFAITSTTAGDAILTPTTPGNFKTVLPGSWIRLSGAANAEYVRVSDTYTIATAPATIPLSSPVVNTGQTAATWDTFGANGPGAGLVMWTGEGFEGVLLNDPANPGFGRAWQGDTLGNGRVTLADGFRASYRASITGLAAVTGATDIFTLTGSATKTVRITRVEFSGTVATAAMYLDVLAIIRSSADLTGTSSSPTVVPLDSSDAAGSATVKAYTGNPGTLGTLVGAIRSDKVLLPLTGTPAQPDRLVWEFGNRPAKAAVLRGIAQVFAINLNAIAIANATLLDIAIEWTEDNS